MTKYGLFGDSFDIRIRHIIGINITDKCICRILCQLFLEKIIIFRTGFLIFILSCQCQIFIHFFIGITGIIGSFIRSENFVGMIICIKRASPADQAGHLSAPVHLCRNFYDECRVQLDDMGQAELPLTAWLADADSGELLLGVDSYDIWYSYYDELLNEPVE